MKLRTWLYSFALTLFIQACSMGQNKNYHVLALPTYEEAIQADSTSLLIDVRTPEEYKEGHIEGAINIDFKSDSFKEEVSKLDRKRTPYIYCRSGNRSKQSSGIFLSQGFEKVYDLKGGYLEYSARTKAVKEEN